MATVKQVIYQVDVEFTDGLTKLKNVGDRFDDLARKAQRASANPIRFLPPDNEMARQLGLVEKLKKTMDDLYNKQTLATTREELKKINSEIAKQESLMRSLKGSSAWGSMLQDARAYFTAITAFEGIRRTASAISGLISKSIDLAKQAELTRSQFITMLGTDRVVKQFGSAEKAADSLLKKITALGVATPFEEVDLQAATTTLLGFGTPIEKVMGTLSKLGDLAGGDADRLQRLATVYGQVLAAGKANAGDINQLINAQVSLIDPIKNLVETDEKVRHLFFETFGKGANVAKISIKEMSEKGFLSFALVDKALTSMTSKGGIAFGGMERASQTLHGRLSTLTDVSNLLMRSFGEKLTPAIKDVVIQLTTMLQRIRPETIQSFANSFLSVVKILWELSKVVAVVGAAWVSYNIILKAVALSQAAYNTAVILTNTILPILASRTRLATAAMATFNMIVRANPIGLLVTAFTASIAVIAAFTESIREAKGAMEDADAKATSYLSSIDMLTNGITELGAKRKELIEKDTDELIRLPDSATFEKTAKEYENTIGSLRERITADAAQTEIEIKNMTLTMGMKTRTSDLEAASKKLRDELAKRTAEYERNILVLEYWKKKLIVVDGVEEELTAKGRGSAKVRDIQHDAIVADTQALEENTRAMLSNIQMLLREIELRQEFGGIEMDNVFQLDMETEKMRLERLETLSKQSLESFRKLANDAKKERDKMIDSIKGDIGHDKAESLMKDIAEIDKLQLEAVKRGDSAVTPVLMAKKEAIITSAGLPAAVARELLEIEGEILPESQKIVKAYNDALLANYENLRTNIINESQKITQESFKATRQLEKELSKIKQQLQEAYAVDMNLEQEITASVKERYAILIREELDAQNMVSNQMAAHKKRLDELEGQLRIEVLSESERAAIESQIVAGQQKWREYEAQYKTHKENVKSLDEQGYRELRDLQVKFETERIDRSVSTTITELEIGELNRRNKSMFAVTTSFYDFWHSYRKSKEHQEIALQIEANKEKIKVLEKYGQDYRDMQKRLRDLEAVGSLTPEQQKLMEDYRAELAKNSDANNKYSKELGDLRQQNDKLFAEDQLKKVENWRQKFMNVVDALHQASQIVIDGIRAGIDIQTQQLDLVIQNAQSRLEKAQDDAQNSRKAGAAEQLQLEQERLDKLLRQKQDFVNQERALATTELVINSIVAVSKAAAEGGALAPITIVATIAALVAGIVAARDAAAQASTGFESGGFTGYGGNKQVAGEVHKNEFVFDAETTRKNKDIFEKVHAGKLDLNKELVQSTRWRPDLNTVLVYNDNSKNLPEKFDKLSQDVQEVTAAVKQIKQTYVEISEMGIALMVSETSKEMNRFKTR